MSWQPRTRPPPTVVAPGSGILSPPLSGRTSKDDEPRIAPAGVLLPAHSDVGSTTTAAHTSTRSESANHRAKDAARDAPSQSSPGKKRGSSMSKAEDRMLTPPLSRDTRMDGGKSDAQTSRSLSDGELDVHHGDRAHQQQHHVHARTEARPTIDRTRQPDDLPARKRRRGPVASGDSDVEENPFMVGSSSPRPDLGQSRARYLEPEEEPESAEEQQQYHEDGDLTPRPRPGKLARPTRERVSVENENEDENQDVSDVQPIRDTPMNPFLEGGPADSGLGGPRARQARLRAQMFPGKEKGKITYVFRGQRVVYADPEYDSDDSDESVYQRTGQRPARLQPKLLFPSVANQPQAGPSRTRGGLFAAEIAARESAAAAGAGGGRASNGRYWPSETSARLQAMTGGAIERERESQSEAHAMGRQMQSNSRTRQTSGADRSRSDRSALLAKLEQANWSEDEEEAVDADTTGRGREREDGSALDRNGEDAHRAARAMKRQKMADGSSQRSAHEDEAAAHDWDADADGEDDLEYHAVAAPRAVPKAAGLLPSAFEDGWAVARPDAGKDGRGLAQRMKRKHA